MSPDDVDGYEMDGPHDFDDEAAESLLGGAGRDADPGLVDLIGDMRVAYTSTPPAVGAALAALIGLSEPVALSPTRRFQQMRASMMAKIGAAAAVIVAATGGLAAAGALPAPVQDAMSHIGVGGSAPTHKGAEPIGDVEESTTTTVDTSVTTVPDSTTSTSVEPGDDHPDNHGEDVSDTAHDDSNEGCEHGHAVAAVASEGNSQGKPCDTTTTTVGEGTTTTTVGDDDGDDGTPPATDEHHGGGDHGGGDHGDSGDHGGDDQGGGGGN